MKIVILISLLLMGCSTPTINHVANGYQLTHDEGVALGMIGTTTFVNGTPLTNTVQHFSAGLPNYVYDKKVTIDSTLDNTLSAVKQSIKKRGKLLEQKEVDGKVQVLGRVGSGSMNMNPAGLVIIMSETDYDTGTLLQLRGVAKEGKIKQNTSGKAVERLLEDISKFLMKSLSRFHVDKKS